MPRLALELAKLRAEIQDLQSLRQAKVNQYQKYMMDPAAYAREVLGVQWWGKQIEIAESLLRPPYRTLVLAGHNVGKTHTAAGVVNWWYDTRNPGVAVTTAPTYRDVHDLLWKEIRLQRGIRGGFKGADVPLLKSAEDHYAKGFTAERGESFQGRHDARMLFVFDEAVGVKPIFWETTKTMFKPEAGHAWLCICNPTDSTSQAYLEEQTGRWTVIRMSAVDHPNVADELAGRPPTYPSAVSLAQVSEGIEDNSIPVTVVEKEAGDIQWPPASGKWWRPGPVAEARWLGRWPRAGTYGVWSDALWESATQTILPYPLLAIMPQIGCDVARFGDDSTSFHVQWGRVSTHHESYNGNDTMHTVGRMIQLAREWAARATSARDPQAQPIDPKRIPMIIDDDGVGGGVSDRLSEQGYWVRMVRAGSVSMNPDDYPNMRCQLWFAAAQLAKKGMMDLHLLPLAIRNKLRIQAMAPTWKLDSAGRRVVESKADTKKRTKQKSPDDMDGLNLAYLPVGTGEHIHVEQPPPRSLQPVPRDESSARRRLFGR